MRPAPGHHLAYAADYQVQAWVEQGCAAACVVSWRWVAAIGACIHAPVRRLASLLLRPSSAYRWSRYVRRLCTMTRIAISLSASALSGTAMLSVTVLSVAVLRSKFKALSHCHTVALSHCRTAALLHCRTVALSHCRTVTIFHGTHFDADRLLQLLLCILFALQRESQFQGSLPVPTVHSASYRHRGQHHSECCCSHCSHNCRHIYSLAFI